MQIKREILHNERMINIKRSNDIGSACSVLRVFVECLFNKMKL